MAVLSVGLGIIALDGTIVGVALPSVITDQQLNPTQAQWVNSLYAVLLAALLLRRARFAGTWGRKRAFLTGLTIFVEGSVLAGFLPPPPLTSARAVQAIGAAFIMPSTLSTVNAVFRGKYRAAAFGVWGAVISGAAALGLLAGGALTEWVSWYSRLSRPDLGWWEPQSSFSFFGWTWSENAPISPVPVALAVSAVGFALSAMAIGAFSPVQQPHVAARFGAPGTVLIGLGLEAVGVLILVLLMGPDTNGWIIAAPLTLYGLGLGFASATQSTVRLGQWCRP